jgi:cytochrome c-type biogenesis protein CcmF
MLAEIGIIATSIALLAAIYSIVASLYGEINHSEKFVISGRNAAITTFIMMLIATGALTVALLNEEYQIRYVWSVTSPDMTAFYRVTALWGSQSGSLLFWSFLMSAFSAASIVVNWKSQRRLMPYAIAYMMATTAFFVGLVLFIENPFERYWVVDGEVISAILTPGGAQVPSLDIGYDLAGSAQGLNPLLRHFGMAYHPPTLYIGFVGFVIPFAYAMAALASGDMSTNWIKAARFWSLISWLFLALGLVLGGRWAYDVLGWGGYWFWDPVENAALLPWLVGTALLHSTIIQEKRGMLKVWNMFLVIFTFSAVIFGTFATRSGLVDSVHAFAQSGIGLPMFFFWGGLTMTGVGLILYRLNRGELKDERALTGILSRETLFVINNLVFIGLFIAVFWGSFGAPIISELFMDTDITLGPEYFWRMTSPLFLAAFVLMGIAPLSAWGKTSVVKLGKAVIIPIILTMMFLVVFVLNDMTDLLAIIGYSAAGFAGFVAIYETYRGAAARVKRFDENWLQAVFALSRRNPRRYGGYLVHIGIVILGIGVVGSTLYKTETQQTLAIGESLELEGYEMRYDSITFDQPANDGGYVNGRPSGRIMDIAEVTVLRGGKELITLNPRCDNFYNGRGELTNQMSIPRARSTLRDDFYVLLADCMQPINGQDVLTFKAYVNPLINLVWWGGVVLIFGTLIAVWPARKSSSRQA